MAVLYTSKLLFVALFIAGCFGAGNVFHFKPEAAASCTNNNRCCYLQDPQYWIENKSPENGDSIVVNADDIQSICFNLVPPLNLQSVETNIPKVAFSIVQGFSIITLFGQSVLMTISGSGTVEISRDRDLSIQGNAVLQDIHVRSFTLQRQSLLTVPRLTVDTSFTTQSSTIMHCKVLHSGFDQFYQAGVLESDTIVLNNTQALITGNVKATTINSATSLIIEESGNVNSETIDTLALLVRGKLNSTTTRVTTDAYVNGTVKAAILDIRPTGSLTGTGTVIGTVVSDGSIGVTLPDQEPPAKSLQLTITGDLWALYNTLHMAIHSTTEGFSQSKIVVHGNAYVNNATVSATFTRGFEIQPFDCAIIEAGAVIGVPLLETNDRASLSLSTNLTALFLSGQDLYIQPTDPASQSFAPGTGGEEVFPWKIATISLACFAGLLVIVIVIVVVRLRIANKKNQYDELN